MAKRTIISPRGDEYFLHLFAWDELSDEIEEREPEELEACNEEGFWIETKRETWRFDGPEDGQVTEIEVTFRETDRHLALECWAVDEGEAEAAFRAVSPYFCHLQDD